MARARNIKPSFFTNDKLAECEPLARILFAGLWTIADREGRLDDNPRKIKVMVLPYDDCSCESLLQQLEKYGFLQRYEIENHKYIQISNFGKHQNAHIKEAASNIPAPDKHHTSTVQNAPHPPSPILKTPSPKPEGFKINKDWLIKSISQLGLENAKKSAPGWDIYNLMEVYTSGVSERGMPDNINYAFPAWCKKYTKGKAL